MSLNSFQVVGNIGKIEHLGDCTRINLVTNQSYKDKNGETQERARWNQVTTFNPGTIRFLKKHGDNIRSLLVTGEMYDDQYEKDGETRFTTRRIVHNLNVMSWKKDTGSSSTPDADQE